MGTGRRCPRAGPQWASRLLAASSVRRPGWLLPARTGWGGARGGRGLGWAWPSLLPRLRRNQDSFAARPARCQALGAQGPSRCAGLPARLEDLVSGPGRGVPAPHFHVQAPGCCGRSAGWADGSVPPGLSALTGENRVGGDGVGGWSGGCETGRKHSVGRGKAPPLSRDGKKSVGLKRAALASSPLSADCWLLATSVMSRFCPRAWARCLHTPRRTFSCLLLLDLQAPRDRSLPR